MAIPRLRSWSSLGHIPNRPRVASRLMNSSCLSLTGDGSVGVPRRRFEGARSLPIEVAGPLEISIAYAILIIAQAVAISDARFDLCVGGLFHGADELERVVRFVPRESYIRSSKRICRANSTACTDRGHVASNPALFNPRLPMRHEHDSYRINHQTRRRRTL
jgi:hypothetical protein